MIIIFLRYTYNFLVVHFQTTDNKVHRLLSFTIGLVSLNIGRVWLVGCAFKVESVGVTVNNLEHGHVFGHLLLGVALFLEAALVIVAVERKVIA